MKPDWRALIQLFLTKMTERSTWLGLTFLVGVAGYQLSPENIELIISAGSTFAGIILIVTKDDKTPPPPAVVVQNFSYEPAPG